MGDGPRQLWAYKGIPIEVDETIDKGVCHAFDENGHIVAANNFGYVMVHSLKMCSATLTMLQAATPATRAQTRTS